MKRIILQHGAKRLLAMMVLLLAFAFNFWHVDAWEDNQGPGDDPVYVDAAYDYWHHGDHGSMTWSPGYIQLMSPFIGMLGKESGYKVWRFVLFAAVSLAVMGAFTQITGSLWFGTVLATFSQLMLMPYLAPSLQMVICLIYLICVWLLAAKEKYLGLVFGLLLNGLYISGTLNFVLLAFAILCLLFYREAIFTRRFFAQLALGVGLFTAVLHYFSYDIRLYPVEAANRGRAGLYHQLSEYLIKSGRVAPYLTPEEADPARVYPSEYERHLNAFDRYYLAKFGETHDELRAYRHDPHWPLFMLDWPWLLEKQPGLMQGYAMDVLRTLGLSLLGSFQAVNPLTAYRLEDYKPTDWAPFIYRAIFNIAAVILLLLVLASPHWVARNRKRHVPALPTGPSRLQWLFLLSTLSALVPLLLVKPLPIYFPPFIPAYLTGLLLIAGALARRLAMPR